MIWHLGGAILAASSLIALQPAYALETGQCLPAAQARGALAAEGQNPVVMGNRTGYGYPTALIFFSNTDGSKGYAVRGDKPLGQEAQTACIDSVYRDVRLSDIAKPGIPAWAKMRVDAATADAACKRYKLGYQESCQAHDISLANLERNGQRVMFMARGTAINPRDRSIRAGQRIVITLKPNERSGLVEAVTADGAGYMLSAYTKASYTQHGEALLDRP